MAGHATLYRMVTEEHVCPFGIKAKDLLERHGYEVEDEPLATRAETDAFQAEHDVETTPQIFIEGDRIGGYDALRSHLGLSKASRGDAYQPIVAVFSVSLAMAFAGSFAMTGALLSVIAFEWFIAISMCVLAILKLRDLESFSNQFITYDLLARRVVRYAYVYPFAEAFAGVGMIAGIWTPLVATTAFVIGTIGAVSVVKAVYLDERELRCACVGGDSEVPLGFVSLSENLMMVCMAGWMILR